MPSTTNLHGAAKLPDRAYLSNINSMWPIERQEALMAEMVPDWGKIAKYKDVLTTKQRQAHGSGLLIERKAMLRATKPRPEGERIYLASMAILAWDGADLELALSGVWERGAT